MNVSIWDLLAEIENIAKCHIKNVENVSCIMRKSNALYGIDIVVKFYENSEYNTISVWCHNKDYDSLLVEFRNKLKDKYPVKEVSFNDITIQRSSNEPIPPKSIRGNSMY